MRRIVFVQFDLIEVQFIGIFYYIWIILVGFVAAIDFEDIVIIRAVMK